jgi:hypothetical protein
MKPGILLLLVAAAVACSAAADSNRYVYNGVTNEQAVVFEGANPHVSVNGQANVAGRYVRPDGTLRVSANGLTHLKVTGRCRAVIIESANGQAVLDLSGLAVGAGGVQVLMMNGDSRLLVDSDGPIVVKAMNGRTEVRYQQKPHGPEVERGDLRGESRIVAHTGDGAGARTDTR